MANELNVSITLSFIKANCQTVTKALSKAITVSGTYTAGGTQLIGTADEVVAFTADLTTIGYVVFQNLDATNFITIGADGSSYPVKLLPGEIAIMRWNGAAIHAKSDSSSCKLAWNIIEA